MVTLLPVPLILILAYLLGSLPTGYLVAWQLKGIDIREVGSGSTGATNVLRVVGKGPAAFVFTVDLLKGVGAVLLAGWLSQRLEPSLGSLLPSGMTIVPLAQCAGGFLAILGHSKPIWLKFQGGKSVATSLGVLLGLNPWVALGGFGAFGIMLALFRIVSLGSIVAAVAVNFLMWSLGQPLPYKIFGLVAGLYVIWRHQSNIKRLLAGTEPRIGQSVPVPPPSNS